MGARVACGHSISMHTQPQDDTVRVLAAYGPDDTPKLDRKRIFVKSIFLLQIVHPDDLELPDDTIIHDLELTDVSPHYFTNLLVFPFPPSYSTPNSMQVLDKGLKTSLSAPRMAKAVVKETLLILSLPLSYGTIITHTYPNLASVSSPVPNSRG